MPPAPEPLPDDICLAVIGLGYVGLPLAASFGAVLPTLGFDIDRGRIDALRQHRDHTREMRAEELQASHKLRFSSDPADLAPCNVYIVTVPTPIDSARQPDLEPLRRASHTVGQVIGRGEVVIFESTVYPGATEEVCIPIIEQASGLTCRRDFHAGYSPERINPGDREHRLADIIKVTSGSSPAAAEFVDALYRRIITAGTHKASSIRVAEAAKVIENTQRDLNIALVNELALIFDKLGLDTGEVLEAAATKWNFLPFRPGLVGGHCIGVDPYYLTCKAQQIGHHPEIILAGRRINDAMAGHVAERVVKLLIEHRAHLAEARVLVLGLAFKANCPDLRNTRVIDVIEALASYHVEVDVHDPWVDAREAARRYGLDLLQQPRDGAYDAVIVAVGHDRFVDLGAKGIRAWCKPDGVLFDVSQTLPRHAVDGRL